MRITGHLVVAETGTDLWADRFEGLVEDVFDLQDRITENVLEPSSRVCRPPRWNGPNGSARITSMPMTGS